LPHFTGIDSPYQAPESADLRLDTSKLSVDACVDELLKLL
jgi:adenylylsulfate kinase-like enzyme